MNVQTALDDFLLACKANQRSLKTIKWYTSLLTDFVEQFSGQELIAIKPREIRLYIVALQEREGRYLEAKQKPVQAGGLSQESISGHIRALHSFWSWCMKEYDLDRNPMDNIERPQRAKQAPKAIALDDYVKLLMAVGNNPAGMRDRAILMFLGDSGCRLGGLLSVRAGSEFLDLKECTAQVIEKGGITRTANFSPYTSVILRDWLEVRVSHTPYVFCSTTDGEPLTDSGIHQILKRLKARAGITGRVNPHSFRHGFAREYLKSGGDEVTLAHLLGHAKVTTTHEFYALFNTRELGEFHAKHTPINKVIQLYQQEVLNENRTKNS